MKTRNSYERFFFIINLHRKKHFKFWSFISYKVFVSQFEAIISLFTKSTAKTYWENIKNKSLVYFMNSQLHGWVGANEYLKWLNIHHSPCSMTIESIKHANRGEILSLLLFVTWSPSSFQSALRSKRQNRHKDPASRPWNQVPSAAIALSLPLSLSSWNQSQRNSGSPFPDVTKQKIDNVD